MYDMIQISTEGLHKKFLRCITIFFMKNPQFKFNSLKSLTLQFASSSKYITVCFTRKHL